MFILTFVSSTSSVMISDQYLVIRPLSQLYTPFSGNKITIYNLKNDSCYWITPDSSFKYSFVRKSKGAPIYDIRINGSNMTAFDREPDTTYFNDSVINNFEFKKIFREKKSNTSSGIKASYEYSTYLKEAGVPKHLTKGLSLLFPSENLPGIVDSNRYYLTHYETLNAFQSSQLQINSIVLNVDSLNVTDDKFFNEKTSSFLFSIKNIDRKRFIEINGRQD